MVFTFTQAINAPIEQVFDCVDDNEKLKIWVEGVEEIIPGDPWNPDDPVGLRFTRRIVEIEGEIVAYDKPNHMEITLREPRFTIKVDYRFTALDESTTHMDYAAEIEYKALIARMMGLAFSWMTRRIVKRRMAAFKAPAESSA